MHVSNKQKFQTLQTGRIPKVKNVRKQKSVHYNCLGFAEDGALHLFMFNAIKQTTYNKAAGPAGLRDTPSWTVYVADPSLQATEPGGLRSKTGDSPRS